MRRALGTGSLRAFLRTEAAGGLVLLTATVIAVAWANSPFGESYESLWHTELRIPSGGLDLPADLRHWVNDALLPVFFFVVGLEIKRELVVGELNDPRKAALPVLAALGGMVVPALLYLALSGGGEVARGWGIPMATDIAFAVGVLALLGDRIPSGLKVFLLSLAIADDIGAIVVIAFFYSVRIDVAWLACVAFLLASVVLLPRLRLSRAPLYVALGIAAWLAMLQSGIHATIAGVALGLLTPVRSREAEVSLAERLKHALHPITSFLIVPLFALANAGAVLSIDALDAAMSSRVTLAIVAGLVMGKIIGISGISWLAVRLKLARLPDGVSWRHLVGASAVAGIGFTVSLFITGLAFDRPEVIAAAKVGVFAGSLTAGIVGAIFLLTAPRIQPAHGRDPRSSPD